MDYAAIIPARGGSKGIPRKNLQPVGGRPMIAWSIAHARAVPAIRRVIVSTDDAEIADVARAHGGDVPFMRPAELSGDGAATEPVLLHALAWLEADGEAPDAIILLQPTSPVRRPGALAAAIRHFETTGADSLLSVCANHHFFWRNPEEPEALYDFRNRPRRQDIAEQDRWYRENGSIYITRVATLRQGNRLGGRIAMHCMTEEESWEIDSPVDLLITDALLKELSRHDH
jgi:CMP-N,N'-diacetyllegionaminic acid synthase